MGWKRDALELLVRTRAVFAPKARACPSEPRSIFVLRNNDIGDVLIITPLFEALRRRFPRARIVAGVGAWAAPVLEGNPHVDAVLPMNAPWHNGQVRPQGLGSALRYIASSPEASALAALRCDIGIDVLGSPFGSLLLMRAGIPWRLGVRGYAGGHSAAQQCVEFDPLAHVGHAALRFAALLGETALPENRPQLFLDASPASSAIVFAPGGSYAAKCWPEENFAALARSLGDHEIVVLGGERDRTAGSQIAQVGAHVRDLTGRLALRESFAAIAAARLVVCNSSMAMHAAAAFHKPALVLLGPAISCATQHAAQWAYPETRLLSQPSVEDAHAQLRQLLGSA